MFDGTLLAMMLVASSTSPIAIEPFNCVTSPTSEAMLERAVHIEVVTENATSGYSIQDGSYKNCRVCDAVEIIVEDAQVRVRGSGIDIGGENATFIVTAKHVVLDQSQITLTYSDGHKVVSGVVALHKDVDLALLKVKGEPKEPIPFATADKKDCIYGTSSWLDFQWVYNDGRIKRVFDDMYLSYGNFAPGSSGSGVYNGRGELVGVVVRYYRDFSNAWHIIPIQHICDMLPKEERATFCPAD